MVNERSIYLGKSREDLAYKMTRDYEFKHGRKLGAAGFRREYRKNLREVNGKASEPGIFRRILSWLVEPPTSGPDLGHRPR